MSCAGIGHVETFILEFIEALGAQNLAIDLACNMRSSAGRKQVSDLCLSSWTRHDVECDDEHFVIF